MASGAVGLAAGVREELKSFIRARIDARLQKMDLITREEFKAVKAMAEQARLENQKLAKELADLKKGRKKSDPKAAKPKARSKVQSKPKSGKKA